ncbi:MBOAT, membrane-bound O-acyltransferase family-domain-containing protein [Sphaerosporella brunnea]|uniref:MBOAT, membrane-bound O-acyltransferase family-domain-containing protein n=1 Tax=Sphaerosporella brunnea TaxID=1250544 RepID=A0A5J5F4S6_9PEZI|nr:MBOAT, membrane-bound O-acyltransferase family-domain-containing protein [Sphaerosporella brunnea]
MAEALNHDLPLSAAPHCLDASSRTSSASSSGSDLVGHLEPATRFRSIVFDATRTADLTNGVDSALETPPHSRPVTPDDFDTEFDDNRLPACASHRPRRSSSPNFGGGGGEVKYSHEATQRRRSVADGLLVSLEKIPSETGQKSRRYVLKVDDEVRELLLAGAREREGSKHRDGTKVRQRRFGDLVFTQKFTAFDRMNPDRGKSQFHGFFILMWLGVILLMIKMAAENYRANGRIFDIDILSIMFTPNHLFDCLLTDAIMFYGSTLWNVPLQRAIVKGYISWNSTGWILQALWEVAFIWVIVAYTLFKEWPWIQTVFLVLHCLVVVMKQHSYAFYNGYLSEVYKRRRVLREKLFDLEEVGGNTHFASLIRAEIEACDVELSLEAENSLRVTYPRNVTYTNYLEYIHFPTVVYELTYPRTLSISWYYVAEKMAATFGVLGIMIVVSQHFIYPVVMHCHSLHSLPLSARLAEFPWILLKLVFPFMGEYLCVWYLIWELILNLLGELTRFSSREFYGEWWNCTTWDAFARDWNKPVHNFLLRHVYHSSISTFQISRQSATLITFLLSSLVHELVMWCIFKKLRGYLLLAQMCQLPLVALSRTRMMKDRKTLGNCLFWLGIWTGPSFLSASYLVL